VSEGYSSALTGFFVLAVTYAGFTQRPAPTLVVLAAATGGWVLSQSVYGAETAVRLGVLVGVWSITGLVLSTLATRERRESLDWVLLANHDSLTGLTNKASFTTLLERHVRGRFAADHVVLFIDLDGFKAINDVFGHATGDHVLVTVSERMLDAVRGEDVVARLGGDEFAILCRCDPGDAETIAGRLVEAIAHPIAGPSGPVAVTASIGIVGLGRSSDAAEVLGSADVAMYRAKRAGKNQVVTYRPAPEGEAGSHVLDVVRALDGEEFELYYQPVVHLHTGATIGVEALLRWNHPDRGVLTPGAFLGACDEAGITEALGAWVVDAACRQAAVWQPEDAERALSVAVNVSPQQIVTQGFLEIVEAATTRAGLDPSLLVLEVSETLALADSPLIRQRLNDLRRFGVRIAIDDFGREPCSLADLRLLPADIIKIDPTFTGALDSDDGAIGMIDAIVGLASALDLDVVGEGVESPLQARLLAEHGCHVAQGYHLAVPLPAPEVEVVLGRARPLEAQA
jgi:diguanylate cyclase (GGDEF)-like protein